MTNVIIDRNFLFHMQSFGTPLDIPPVYELAPLLNDQHTLLQHLEGQVSYYKVCVSLLSFHCHLLEGTFFKMYAKFTGCNWAFLFVDMENFLQKAPFECLQ